MLPLRTLVGVEAALLRQGEGDIRKPFPPPEAYASTPLLFEGVVARTWRLGLSVASVTLAGLAIQGWAGVHFVTNADHVSGATSRSVRGSLHGGLHAAHPIPGGLVIARRLT